MKTLQKTTSYELWEIPELSKMDRDLVEAAKQATRHSYAPYSAFHVGCAMRLSDGRVVTGSNQENASYPCGTCAERSALYNVGANYPEAAIVDMAIAAEHEDAFTGSPLPPCGLCRQALLEAEQRQSRPIRLLMYGARQVLVVGTVSDLLPFQFDANMMG